MRPGLMDPKTMRGVRRSVQTAIGDQEAAAAMPPPPEPAMSGMDACPHCGQMMGPATQEYATNHAPQPEAEPPMMPEGL